LKFAETYGSGLLIILIKKKGTGQVGNIMVAKSLTVSHIAHCANIKFYAGVHAIVVCFGEKGKNWRDIAKIISHLTGDGITVKTLL